MWFGIGSLRLAAVMLAGAMLITKEDDQIDMPSAVAHPAPFNPPVDQTAKCVGVDEANARQTLILHSRWIEAEHTTAVFVVEDSSGSLKKGEWLENQNSTYRDGDRKHGISADWNDADFSKRLKSQYVRITIQEINLKSASILYIVRPFTTRELTGARYSIHGTIVLAGRCALYVGGKERTSFNMPDPPRAL